MPPASPPEPSPAYSLERLGWNAFFQQHYAPRSAEFGAAESGVARVARQERAVYLLYSPAGEITARIAGRLRHQAGSAAELPAVGDWVLIRARPAEAKATIHGLLPRRTRFARRAAGIETTEQVLAANIDVVFLVMGLDHDFNLRRIERYLSLAWDSGATPVVVLNKADVCEDVPARVADVEAVAMGVPVEAISAGAGNGLQNLLSHVAPGKTAALLGSSGVGKSTIINALMGSERQQVRPVREDDSRGRHTTTRRELFLLPSGGLMIDTPGMREIQMWVAPEGLREAFEDIAGLADRCYFGNCSHHKERGCAVQQAIAAGEADASRLESFRRLQREMEYTAMKQEHKANYVEKQRWKKGMAAIGRQFHH